jgi:hypothetical protein
LKTPGIKRLFWDVETSPNVMYSWRAGYKLNLGPENIVHERAMICNCFKFEGSEDIGSLEWDFGDDQSMIEEFAYVSKEADELVAHNGDKFDIRWFNARNLIHGLPPLPDYKTVDTCAIAKRKFYLNSYKLDYLANLLLGEGKVKTEFNLWKEISLPVMITEMAKQVNGEVKIPKDMMDHYKRSMNFMVEYCKRDVVILEKVFEKLQPYYKQKTHAGVAAGKERWTCMVCTSENVKLTKTRPTPMGMIQRQMYCKDCGKYYTVSDLVYRMYLKAKGLKAVARKVK